MSTETKPESLSDFIRSNYPDRNPKDVFTKELAGEVFGPLPGWSTRDGGSYQISPTTRTDDGNFLVAHFADPSVRNPDTGRGGEVFVVMQKRGDKGPSGEDRFGALGGYGNADYQVVNWVKDATRGESTRAGAIREVNEELLDDKGVPILNLNEERLKILNSDIDYRKRPGVHWTGFEAALSPDEYAAVKTHAERIAKDAAYATAVTEASHGEVAEIIVKPLREVIAMQREQFTHPHELDCIVELADRLKSKSAERSVAGIS